MYYKINKCKHLTSSVLDSLPFLDKLLDNRLNNNHAKKDFHRSRIGSCTSSQRRGCEFSVC